MKLFILVVMMSLLGTPVLAQHSEIWMENRTGDALSLTFRAVNGAVADVCGRPVGTVIPSPASEILSGNTYASTVYHTVTMVFERESKSSGLDHSNDEAANINCSQSVNPLDFGPSSFSSALYEVEFISASVPLTRFYIDTRDRGYFGKVALDYSDQTSDDMHLRFGTSGLVVSGWPTPDENEYDTPITYGSTGSYVSMWGIKAGRSDAYIPELSTPIVASLSGPDTVDLFSPGSFTLNVTNSQLTTYATRWYSRSDGSRWYELTNCAGSMSCAITPGQADENGIEVDVTATGTGVNAGYQSVTTVVKDFTVNAGNMTVSISGPSIIKYLDSRTYTAVPSQTGLYGLTYYWSTRRDQEPFPALAVGGSTRTIQMTGETMSIRSMVTGFKYGTTYTGYQQRGVSQRLIIEALQTDGFEVLGEGIVNENGSGTVRVNSQGENTRVAAYDVLGREVMVLHSGHLMEGLNLIPFDLSGSGAGMYYIVIRKPEGVKTYAVVVR